MKYAYSYREVRRAETELYVRGTTPAQLMERAGSALADAVFSAMQRRNVPDVLFVCGGGNNGGDGYVAARILFVRGVDAQVLSMANTFSSDCEAAKNAFKGEILGRIPRRRYGIIVDCLFGTGISRPIEGSDRALVEFINASGAYVISCDVPSGLAEGGVAFSPAVRADETLSIGLMKQSLLLAAGADLAGRVTVAEIGLNSDGGAMVLEDADVQTYFPPRPSDCNKGDFGTAAILAGEGSLGASLLAARAALKSGAGYTKLLLPKPLLPSPGSMLAAISPMPACMYREATAGEIGTASALAFGMGAGTGEETYARVEELLKNFRGSLVLDADALNSLAAYGLSTLDEKKCRVVITPHIKEFSRLTGKPVSEVLSGAVGYAKSFANRHGVTVVLKNNRTIITDGTRTVISPTGSPALAKGGSGDVLSGLLAGTLARGLEPFEAAAASCYLLGRAGEIMASEEGEYAPEPSELPSYFARALRSIRA